MSNSGVDAGAEEREEALVKRDPLVDWIGTFPIFLDLGNGKDQNLK
jgi:hypothetical protein